MSLWQNCIVSDWFVDLGSLNPFYNIEHWKLKNAYCASKYMSTLTNFLFLLCLNISILFSLSSVTRALMRIIPGADKQLTSDTLYDTCLPRDTWHVSRDHWRRVSGGCLRYCLRWCPRSGPRPRAQPNISQIVFSWSGALRQTFPTCNKNVDSSDLATSRAHQFWQILW